MTAHTGVLTHPQPSVHKQIELRFVLRLEKIQVRDHAQTVQPVLLQKQRGRPLRQPGTQLDRRQLDRCGIRYPAKKVQIRQMRTIGLPHGYLQIAVRRPLNGKQMQIRLRSHPVPRQFTHQRLLPFQNLPYAVGEIHLTLVEQAKKILLRHRALQLMLLQTNVIRQDGRLHPDLLLGGPIRAAPQQRLGPRESGVQMTAALAQVIPVIIRPVLRVPLKRGPSPVFGNDRHEKILPVQLQTGAGIKRFQSLPLQPLHAFPVAIILKKGTVPPGRLHVKGQVPLPFLPVPRKKTSQKKPK